MKKAKSDFLYPKHTAEMTNGLIITYTTGNVTPKNTETALSKHKIFTDFSLFFVFLMI